MRLVWDGNVPLHEWTALEVGADNVDEVVTWLFEEDSFVPAAKLTAGGSYSIVTDHLGAPSQMHDETGELLWAAQIDGFGAVRFSRGKSQDCPFRYQGQYEDVETGLYYNRFRYYEPSSGQYISQDPLRLEGGNPNAYAYVSDCNVEIDPLGLKECKIWRKAKKDYWKSKHSSEVAALLENVLQPIWLV